LVNVKFKAMRNKEIPFYWNAQELVLVNFYRYTSFVTDTFIEVERDEREKYPKTYAFFDTLQKRVRESYIKTDYADVPRRDLWDNKVVIECLTSQGNKIFVGYYDFRMSIGLGVKSDSWVKPYPILKELVYNEADYWDGDESDKISY